MAMQYRNLTDVLNTEDRPTIIQIIGDGAVNDAIQSATNAALSETNAATSATNASTSETNASASATSSASSATNSANSATASANSATASATSATNALASENKALKWAEELEDVQVETGKYSALHWAAKASTFNPALYGTLAGANIWAGEQSFKETKDTWYDLGAGTVLDPANGGMQSIVLTGNITFTENFENGQAITLRINNGSSYTVTYPTMNWYTASGNVAPTLNANDYIVLWKENNALRGAYVGYFS